MPCGWVYQDFSIPVSFDTSLLNSRSDVRINATWSVQRSVGWLFNCEGPRSCRLRRCLLLRLELIPLKLSLHSRGYCQQAPLLLSSVERLLPRGKLAAVGKL